MRSNLKTLLLVSAIGVLSNCSPWVSSSDCASDPVCNPLSLVLSYRQPQLAVGSNLTFCQAYRMGVDGEFGVSQILPEESCKFLDSVAYGNGRYVAVGTDTFGETPTTRCIIHTSVNGRDWSLADCQATPGSGLGPMAFGNGLFVAASRGSLAAQLRVSTDGLNWTPAVSGLSSGVNVLFFHAGQFYAGVNDGLYATPDPRTTPFTNQGAGTESFEGLAAGSDGRLVAITINGTTPGVKLLVPGGVWQSGSNFFTNASGGERGGIVLFDSGRFYAIGSDDNGTGASCLLDESADGLSWQGGYIMNEICNQSGTGADFQSLGWTRDGFDLVVTGLGVVSGQPTPLTLRSSSPAQGNWRFSSSTDRGVVIGIVPAQ